MLVQLQISNVALIDKLNIELADGLNVLTGETGAGKSIIIDSINAILGERLSRDLIRTGTEKASVEAVFQVENARFGNLLEGMGIEPEEDGTLIISREYTAAGRNTCRINGKMATVSMLKEVGERLIDIHGQYDNQSLLRTESHIDLLDSFGGDAIMELKHRYQQLLEKYRSIKNKLRGLSGDKNDRERRIDLIKYQIEEIKKAKLKPQEDENLNRQRVILSSSEKIMSALANAYDFLYGGDNGKSSAADGVNNALAQLESIVKLDEKYGGISKKLEELSYLMDDAVEDLRRAKEEIEFNPDLLEQIEERLDVIYRLKKKYGASIAEVLEYGGKLEAELEEILRSEELITELGVQLSEVESELFKAAKELNGERRKACKILEDNICDQLEDLEMKKARFKVNIEFQEALQEGNERKYLQNGLDRVEFLISANAGEPLKPLSKIASGGEMSRIMLAIKTILADVDHIPTLIFDEIDIGVSGKAAQKVGEKLSYISATHQVICVTHLAQIACMADSHYLIEKISRRDSTVTRINKLGESGTKQEVARILGGANISEITLKHAEEMLKNASGFKKSASGGR